MLEIPSIIRIIAEIHLLKLCDLKPQGYRVRDSNHFTYVLQDGIDFPKLVIYHLAIHAHTCILSYINYLAIYTLTSQVRITCEQ